MSENNKLTKDQTPQAATVAAPPIPTKPTTGVIHGSNLILGVNIGEVYQAIGYCKTCSVNNKAETKDRAHKNMPGGGKWKAKSVAGLSVSISAEGFSCFETTAGFINQAKLLELWEAGESVELRYSYRGEENTTYRKGMFAITALDETAAADDDATFSVSFENDGPVTPHTITTNP